MRLILSFILCLFITSPLFATSSFANDYEAGKQAYDAGDYETAYEIWLPLAKEGDAEAAHKIGYMYGIEGLLGIDLIKAQHWYLTAIRSGSVKSMFNIALILRSEKLDQKYSAESICWLLTAKDENFPDASNILEQINSLEIPRNMSTKIKTLREKGECTSIPLR